MIKEQIIEIDAKTNQKDLFTNVYSRIRKAKTRFVVVYGGASSSKSHSVHQNELLNTLEDSPGDTLFIRKYGTDLYDSCYKLLQKIADGFDLIDLFSWNYSNAKRQIENKATGKRILLKGIDDHVKLKSIVGIKRVVIEEAEQLTQEDFNEINRRVRGIENIQITVIFNPVDSRHWLKSYFFDNEKVRVTTTIIHAVFTDNERNLTEVDIEQLQNLQFINPNDYRIYVLGEWGKAEVKRPYIYNFDRNKHVSESAIFRPKFQIYFSVDFNLEPLVCTAHHVWFDRFGSHWHTFKEFVLKLGSVPELCDRVHSSFEPHQLASALWTGDATGRKREIITRDNLDAWHIIDKSFNLGRRLRVPRSNPIVRENRHLMNAIYALHPDRKIHPDCSLLINELQFTEADTDGSILKKDRNKMEQRADALDTDRYLGNTFLFDFITKSKKYVQVKVA